ncbi:MAG: tetratricopeptide repeat protein, partial [Spirochaetota bacterium]
LEQRDDNHVPYYYIGLIHYSRGDYETADMYYREALDRGGPEGLMYFALGVNAFADEMFDSAVEFLERATDRDPESFEERAQQLIARIGD